MSDSKYCLATNRQGETCGKPQPCADHSEPEQLTLSTVETSKYCLAQNRQGGTCGKPQPCPDHPEVAGE